MKFVKNASQESWMRVINRTVRIVRGIIATSLLLGGSICSAEQMPQVNDATHMVIATLFKGDFERTRTSIENLSGIYHRFLTHYMADEDCQSSLPALNSCRKVYEAELKAINQGTWSQGFVFDRAEFNHSLGIYNLEKKLLVDGMSACAFILQITAELKTVYLLNKEFFISCNNR
jgi:hypothetical protein